MLTLHHYERHSAVPGRWYRPIATIARTLIDRAGVQIDIAGPWPTQPSLLVTNSTQRHDFILVMRAFDAHSIRVSTLSKAKNYHSRWQALFMRACGTVPIVSRGYLIAVDFITLFKRRPTEAEYRQLRDHVDIGTELPAHLERVLHTARNIGGQYFSPSTTSWGAHVHGCFHAHLQQTIRLARSALDAGLHVQIYPEGTVSSSLGTGRTGAVQLAHALGVPMVPVGLNGAPDVFHGATPLPRAGRVHLRFGAPLRAALPADHRPFLVDDERRHAPELAAATRQVMTAIEGLLEPRFARRDSAPSRHGLDAVA